MPKENKHGRGRRDENKRKRDDAEDEAHQTKRRNTVTQDHFPQDMSFAFDNPEPAIEEAQDGAVDPSDRPFYGMLEDEEQEYFRRADELLELNDFPSPEERSMFLANVYREAEGKELKIACSQSCSRLMERLILLSTVDQKKKLFQNFSGNFPHLVQHRFASHCCETLFVQSALIVTDELTGETKVDEEMKDGDMFVSMENLFLYTLNELEGQLATLLTDRFGSHTLRVLLIILSGRPLQADATQSLIQSKKKEKVGINGLVSQTSEVTLNKRAVPESFQFAVEKIISDTVATMDTSFIRILATHPVGNPALQLLLELELTNPNSRKGANASRKTLISTLLPDDIAVDGSQSAVLVGGLLYEPIGSRLLETIVSHAPGKLFKQIYKAIFKDRIAALARNEISSYIVVKVLTRLSKEDLEEAVESISPQIEGLVTRNRTMVVKTLLERCQAREADTENLTSYIAQAYGSDPATLILKMADITLDTLTSATAASKHDADAPKPPKPTMTQVHGSSLAQTMLSIQGPPSTLIQTALLALPLSTLLSLALHPTTTHIIQAALAPPTHTLPTNLAFRRKLINILTDVNVTPAAEDIPVLTLSLSPIGSHVMDALLYTTTTLTSTSTSSLFSLCERIAMSLLPLEAELRDSFSGRIVWRNWSMDLYRRRRGDWVKKIRAPAPSVSSHHQTSGHVQSQSSSRPRTSTVVQLDGANEGENGKNSGGREKTAIELAREKFAKDKAKKGTGNKNKGMATGANTI